MNHTMSHIWLGSRKWVFRHGQVLSQKPGHPHIGTSLQEALNQRLSETELGFHFEIGTHQAPKTFILVQTDSKETPHSETRLLSSSLGQDLIGIQTFSIRYENRFSEILQFQLNNKTSGQPPKRGSKQQGAWLTGGGPDLVSMC